MAKRTFESEIAARREIFRICEQHNRLSWATPDNEDSLHKSRAFARTMPLYRDGDQWKVGLQEYLSNMTSDFSDGTNGEPSTSGPHPGDGDTQVGIPDYKYLDRLKKRREKVKALIQRRDHDGIEPRIEPAYIQKLLQHSRLGEAAQSFEEWFAGSQVADASGNPVVVYHSSPFSFRKFDTSAEGAHFGSYDQASNLRKPGKREPKGYFLSIKNPLRMQDIGGWNHFSNFHSTLAREDIINDEQTERAWQAWQRSDAEGWETLKQVLKENGYDGIVYENELEGPGDSWIAFWSHQIRPARVQVTSPPLAESIESE